LASEAIYVEQQILKENVGVQDQIMASYGGIRLIDVGPHDRWRAAKMYLSSNYMKEFESHIMLGFSGVSRYAEEQSKVQVNNIKEGKSEMELRAMVALADDAIDSIGREDDMYVLGNLLNLGWSIKRKLADGISKDWIDEIYQQSLECGSLGGKLMGAGGGGFAGVDGAGVVGGNVPGVKGSVIKLTGSIGGSGSLGNLLVVITIVPWLPILGAVGLTGVWKIGLVIKLTGSIGGSGSLGNLLVVIVIVP